MKKCFLLFLFICNLSFGQNWAPIVSSNTYNYFSSQSFSSACIIKTDSIFAGGSDSVFYLNRIIKPFNSTKYLNNQGQFLQKKVTHSAGGYVTFKGDSSFTLKINAGFGDSWVYDSIQNLIATIIDVKKDSVLGNLDSIKIISVSNLDTIILSKNYGITYFKKQSLNVRYTLKGIQNLGLGYRIPMFSEIFDYNIGDVFEYRDTYDRSTSSIANTFINHYHYKLTILGKTINGSTILYTAQKLSSDTLFSGFGYPYHIKQKDTLINISYTDSTKHTSNLINNSVVGGQCYYGGDPNLYKISFDDNSLFSCPVKILNDKKLLPNINNDTLVTSLYNNGICHTRKIFGKNFGMIYYYNEVTITGDGKAWTSELIGSIKNGVQYGTITNYTISPIAVQEYQNQEAVKVYPTVFSDKVTVSINTKTTITITDALGRLLHSTILIPENEKTSNIDLGYLENGNYFMTLTSPGNKPVTKKIIKVD